MVGFQIRDDEFALSAAAVRLVVHLEQGLPGAAFLSLLGR